MKVFCNQATKVQGDKYLGGSRENVLQREQM